MSATASFGLVKPGIVAKFMPFWSSAMSTAPACAVWRAVIRVLPAASGETSFSNNERVIPPAGVRWAIAE